MNSDTTIPVNKGGRKAKRPAEARVNVAASNLAKVDESLRRLEAARVAELAAYKATADKLKRMRAEAVRALREATDALVSDGPTLPASPAPVLPDRVASRA